MGSTAEDRFDVLGHQVANRPGVTLPTDAPGAEGRFGAAALKVDQRIFAMLRRGQLVVKLPRQRVAALIASGDGEPFDAGKGRPMAEWVCIATTSGIPWLSIATEAMEFVASKR